MATHGLLERVRYRANAISGHYFPGRTKQTIVAPSLGNDSGLIGAIELGRRAAADVAAEHALGLVAAEAVQDA